MSEQRGLVNFTPKTSFFLGIGVALLVFFVIGFFVLLGIVLRGDKDGLAGGPAGETAEPTSQVAGETAEPTEIVITPVNDQDYVYGNPDAKISIIEFSDLECPFCKQFHPTVKNVVSQYPDNVNWIYRHFPLTSLHTKAPKEAEAAECAGELGGNDGFWNYVDKIFAVTPSNDGLDLSTLPDLAAEVGLDKSQFQSCLDSGKYASKVADQYNQAIAAGGQGTPYLVILYGDQKIPVSGAVPEAQLKSMIDSLLGS